MVIIFLSSVIAFLLLWIGMVSYMINYYVFFHRMHMKFGTNVLLFKMNGKEVSKESVSKRFKYTNIPGIGIHLNLEISKNGLRFISRFNNIDNYLKFEKVVKLELITQKPFELIGGILIHHTSKETPNPLYIQHPGYKKLYSALNEQLILGSI